MINLLNFLLLAADITPTETPPPMPSYEGAMVKMLLTVLALIVGIFVTVWILKRLAAGRFASGGAKIKIIERKPLSQKTMLYVIEIEGQQTLIAESQLEIKPILTLEEAPEKS